LRVLKPRRLRDRQRREFVSLSQNPLRVLKRNQRRSRWRKVFVSLSQNPLRVLKHAQIRRFAILLQVFHSAKTR